MLIFSRIWILFTVFNQIRLKNYQIKKNKIFNFLHKISQKQHFVAQKRQFSSSVSRKWPSGETTWRQKPRWRWCLWRHGRPWPCEWVAGGSLTGWAKRTSRGATPAGARFRHRALNKLAWTLFRNSLTHCHLAKHHPANLFRNSAHGDTYRGQAGENIAFAVEKYGRKWKKL